MNVEDLLDELSTAEQASFTAGADMWSVPGVARLGIPSMRMTDGPNGARGSALLGTGRETALCVPCGTSLGASWDPALVEEVGQALGEETRTKGARILLAPTINLHRHPLGGRGFECYAEDPLLSGVTAAAFVRGVQSRGVAATAKHLVANEAEFERTTLSSEVSERALRELYLVPFEHAIRDGGLLAVMTAYNRLNGRWCSEDRALLTDWLREEIGFTGVVMTDWFAAGSTAASAAAGLGLQMPGADRFFGAPLAAAVDAGEVDPQALRRMARSWLSLIEALGAWDDQPAAETSDEKPQHREIARRAAAAGTVLLRNDGTLPLVDKGAVALIGPLAARAHLMGGGSAQLRPHRSPSLYDVLAPRLGDRLRLERGVDIDRTVRPMAAPGAVLELFAGQEWSGPVHERLVQTDLQQLWFGSPSPGLDEDDFSFRTSASVAVRDTGAHTFTLVQAGRARLLVDGVCVLDGISDPPPAGQEFFGLGSQERQATVDLVAGTDVSIVLEWTSTGSVLLHGAKVGHRPPTDGTEVQRAVEAARQADVAVVVVGTTEEWESEGHDRSDLALPGDQDALVAAVAAANPRTVVVVCAGAPVTMPWADDVAAILLPWLGGQEVAHALDDVLFGAAEPAGRLPVTFPVRLEHTPAFGTYPGENDRVGYAEDLLVGYRWYDTRRLPVAFPFGHGGSYTTFGWGPGSLSGRVAPGEDLRVRVEVTNTGDRAGSEVVQVYVRPHAPRLKRPRSELKGFAKVTLAPGESTVVEIVLDVRSFAHWDPGSADHARLREELGDGSVVPAVQGPTPRTTPGWYVDDGTYDLVLARSAAQDVEVLTVAVGGQVPATGVGVRHAPG